METILDKKRNVFPRWRSPDRTTGAELASTSFDKPIIDKQTLQARFEFLYEKWRAQPTLEAAAEVLDSAILIPDPFLAYGPASAILNNPQAMPAVRSLAKFILKENKQPEVPGKEFHLNLCDTREEGVRIIREIKARLVDEPRNSLLWLEKARLQTQIGDINGAKAAMRLALTTAPENREVLRAYSRFMVHIGESREAHARLLKAERIKGDPWIQAAEIALAQEAGKKPHSVRNARAALNERRLPPIFLSELAAAMGTLEILQGSTPLAKRHFKQSPEAPTENALSQAYWVKQTLSTNIVISAANLAVPCAFEARVRDAVFSKKWTAAVDNCKRWINDEPFSLRAAIDGSYIASSLAWSSEDALEICDFGLIANPNDVTLINNRAVALIRSNRLDEAARTLAQLKYRPDDESIEPFIPATYGLLHFAKGEFELARQGYSRAIEEARKRKAIDIQFRAVAHWAYEEIVAGNLGGEEAATVVRQMDKTAQKLRFATAEVWRIMKDRALARDYDPKTPGNGTLPLLFSNMAAIEEDIQ